MSYTSEEARLLGKLGLDVQNRRIYVNGIVTDNTYKRMVKCMTILESLSTEDISIFLNSDGGDITAAFAIISLWDCSPCVIETVAIGNVYSIGIVLLAAGTVRKAMPNTHGMWHSGVVQNPESSLTLKTLKSETAFLKGLEDRSNDILAAHTNKDTKFWKKLGQEDNWFFEEQMLEWGLIDSIYTGEDR